MKRFIDVSQFVLVLLGLVLCGLFVVSLLGLLPLKEDWLKWTIFAGQNVIAFVIPAMLAWKICFKTSPVATMEMDRFPSAKMIGFMLLVYFAGIPALNQIVYWNQEMQLPEALSAFEQWCRELEDAAQQQTVGLLGSTAILPLLVNILVIGVLTGIGEEFLFRGALQRMLIWCRVNPHVAIWTAAVIFSAIHFQFFGFVPRVLLGAFFGYLYWWSGSIWLNSMAHALNNSLVIVSTWCIHKGLLSEEFDMIGVSEGGIPVVAIISAVAVALLIYLKTKTNGTESK